MVRARGFEPPMWEYPGRLKVYYTQPLCDARIWYRGMESNHRQRSYKGRPITTWVPLRMVPAEAIESSSLVLQTSALTI